MSFDDYANHIYQKHRLAVALAIIKSKPSNVDTAKYLEELKSKVQDKMDDDDVTVCSDDFLINDDDDDMNDSVTILKDFDLENVGNVVINEENCSTNKKTNTLPHDLSQRTYYESSQTLLIPNINDSNITNYDENHNRNHKSDIEYSIPKNIVNRSVESNVIIENPDHDTFNYNDHTVSIKESNIELKDSNYNPINMDSTYYESQKTVLYTVHGFTDNYTHCSPSQGDIIIPHKYIYSINKNQINSLQNKDRNQAKNNITNADANTKINSSQNINDFSNETLFTSKENNTESISYNKNSELKTINEDFEYNQTINVFSQRNDDFHNEIQDYNIHLFKEKDITINNKNINDDNANSQPDYFQNIDEYFEEIQYVKENGIGNTRNKEISKLTDMEITDEVHECSQNTYPFSQNINITNNDSDKVNNDTNKTISDCITAQNDNNRNTQKSENNDQLSTLTNKNDISEQNNDIREEYKIAEEECESEEIISYKVLEEFNKVKTFLNRQNRRASCDGYSTDSGYRSDSQIRSSNRSALQLSGNWLNQSGCCLFNYIMQCSLVASTRDITNEIAQVLSQLIDRLHEEEKYPSFLEELLEAVDVLLQQVHEGESSGDNDFLKKDESIQRILLLNKSIHIQKHSIEKISKILEIFHSKVTETDSTYELSNIDQMENISYIFHILEILLKIYLKCKDLLSQSSTQPSQDEDKLFKKSSITDIWRKKWNPNQKVFEGSREKKCVLKICSDVLNKIVVDCVSCYSLVAYSALKCFNSMQS